MRRWMILLGAVLVCAGGCSAGGQPASCPPSGRLRVGDSCVIELGVNQPSVGHNWFVTGSGAIEAELVSRSLGDDLPPGSVVGTFYARVRATTPGAGHLEATYCFRSDLDANGACAKGLDMEIVKGPPEIEQDFTVTE